MAYATEAQLKDRFDRRFVDQLSNDSNTTVGVTGVLTAVLEDATAEIKTAALQGGIYTSSQLSTLASNNDNALVRLTCLLAMRNLAQRRGQGLPDGLRQQTDEAVGLLESIRKGTRVFDVAAVRDADQPEVVTLTSDEKENLESLTATEFFEGGRDTPTA